MPRTITVELDDTSARALAYCSAERADGDEAEAIRQAIEAYSATILVAAYEKKLDRIAAEPQAEGDEELPMTPEVEAAIARLFEDDAPSAPGV